jgi:adenine-specific DNA-methyltransferase
MDRTEYDIFVKKLREMFMMDHAELDFGIYRIMNYKREEIDDFLTNKLLPQVETILKSNLSADGEELKQELEQAINESKKLGFNPEQSTKVKELRAKLSSTANYDDLQSTVFSRLTQFFSRYYKDGDFISQRRYKSNGDSAYMMPYNGEEVKLCWANQDQYYIKTSEYFKNYTFILPNFRKKVHFVLKDASTEQNNNKNTNGMERRFALWKDENGESTPLAIVDGELEIYFTYELMPKATKQKDLLADAYNTLSPILQTDEYKEWLELLKPAVKADQTQMDITWLQKHLQDYTAKNTFDYFIHKDLGGFLRRELDFFLKNEVLVVDDLTSAKMASTLAVIKAIEEVGGKIITFLAQLENFQKKLWLKKKFVVGCDYCITLDRVPEELYPEIIANDDQRREWVRLFAIDDITGDLMTKGYSEPLTMDFLKQNPYLVLDTKFFSLEFKHKLLASIEDIDGQCNGLLINSENFQALQLIHEKYSKRVKCIYIDPPYNADSSEILYKNTFKHSSWLSLMENRLSLANNMLEKEGVEIVAIDEVEQCKLSQLLIDLNPGKDVTPVSVVHNPNGQQGYNISFSSEYAIFVYPSFKGRDTLGLEERKDSNGWDTRTFRDNSGNSNLRTDAKNCFYPIYVKDKKIVGFGDVCPDDFHPVSRNENESDGIIAIYPIDNNGVEKKWVFERGTVESIKDELWVKEVSSSEIEIMRTKKKFRFKSCWFDKKYSANSYGSRLLTEMNIPFGYPKSIYNVQDCIIAGMGERKDGVILDFFAGSGTTAHAVIMTNKADNGSRKYLLAEMGNYFDVATRARIEKAIYSEDWKDGKPVSRKGVSQCFKYIRLEQYEDTLNNLVVRQSMPSSNDADKFNEDYMLGYMLDMDTKGSLLNLKMFRRPFDVKIKTTKDNELIETPVDMVETFNYLIGLNIETENWYNDGNICVVEGVTHEQGEKTLVIWRNMDVIDNDALNKFFLQQDFKTRGKVLDTIYVNGDNTLAKMKSDEEHWKVMMTEQEFKDRMFEED